MIRQRTYQVGILVKVSTADEEIVVDDNEFISAVYSNMTYSVNKQLDACSSHRSPKFVPYRDNERSAAEVVQVHLPENSATYNRTSIVLAAIEKVKDQLGLEESIQLGNFVDFVVFCVPTGLAGPIFLASGAYNSFWVVAKPSACTNPRILLHEFGHMLGLKHARQADDEYGDETSVMGRTSNAQNRCFNGYNFWKLQWFHNDHVREIKTSLDLQLPIKIALAAFVDASKLLSKHEQSVVVLKIDDYYLVYNRRKGYNDETGELPDMVTIVQALNTEESELVIGLNETEGSNVYRYTNNASQLVTIQTCNRHYGDTTTADRFVVAIGMDDFPCINKNTISERTIKAPSRTPIIRSIASSTPSLRSERPKLATQRPLATPVLDKLNGSSTPSKGEVYTVQSSHPSAHIPIQASKTTFKFLNRTLTPTRAPRYSEAPTEFKPYDTSAPIIRQSNIDYAQSPFPPILHGGQRQNDTATYVEKDGGRYVTYNVAMVSTCGLALIAFVLFTIRIRKRRIANQRSILLTKT